MFKDLLGEAFVLIEKFAPAIADALGSPIAGVGTSFVLSLLGHAFGLPDGDHKNLSNKILSDPEAIEKLKELNTRVPSSFDLKNIDVNFKVNFDHEKCDDKAS